MEEVNHLEEIIVWNEVAGNDKGDLTKAPTYIDLVKEEYAEWLDAIQTGNEVEELDALIDLIWVIVGRAHTKGYNFFAALEEVHNSNFSKFLFDEELVQEAVEFYKKEGVVVTPRKSGDLTVLIDENGKIRKPPSYTKADVSPYV